MENREVDKSKLTKKIIILVIFLVLVIGLVILLVNLLGEKVTYTSTDNKSTASTSLICETNSTDVDGAFFDVKDSKNATQQLKAIFNSKKIDSLSYSATINYDNYETAKKREAELHFKYGSYMQDNGKEMTDYSPNFSVNDQEVKINLYATKKQIIPETARIFLINATESAFDNFSPNSLKALYESKGFDCEIKE